MVGAANTHTAAGAAYFFGGATLVQDSLAITDALVALSQGDLTTRLNLTSQPVSLSGSPELDRLKNLFNTIISSLQGSANEFNVLTDEPCQRLFYVGADAYLEGRTCGEIMGQALGGKRQCSHYLWVFYASLAGLRRKGFEAILQSVSKHTRRR